MSEFVTIARIVKSRGVKGEVAAEILTDFPGRFERVQGVRVSSPAGTFRETLESHRFHKGRVLLKFQGRDSPDQVRELLRGDVEIPLEERVPLPEGRYYQADLVGCRVMRGGEDLGTVESILETGGGASNLVVRDPEGLEWQLPLVRRFVRGVDLERGRIEADPPPGLMELKVGSGPGKRKKRRARLEKAQRAAREGGGGERK